MIAAYDQEHLSREKKLEEYISFSQWSLHVIYPFPHQQKVE